MRGDVFEDRVRAECPRCGGAVEFSVENREPADREVPMGQATVDQLRALVGRQKQCDRCDSMVWLEVEIQIGASPPQERPEPIPTGAGGYFYGGIG